jgi:hypothetical protein
MKFNILTTLGKITTQRFFRSINLTPMSLRWEDAGGELFRPISVLYALKTV